VTSTFEGIADSLVIELAKMRLVRMRLKGMTVTSRERAINILKSMRPAPPKTVDLGIKPAVRRPSLCHKCGKPIAEGEPCKTSFSGNLDEHIECHASDKLLAPLYAKAAKQVTWG